MALRKHHAIALADSLSTAHFIPFVNGLDNGEVHITQGGQHVVLSYNDVAHLYGTTFPEKSYKCVDGVGVEIDNFATLTDAEREYMYSIFPHLRPQTHPEKHAAAPEAGALSGVLSEGN